MPAHQVIFIGLQVSGLKAKMRVSQGLPDKTVQSVHVCSEDKEIFQSFTYPGNAVKNNGSGQEDFWQISQAHAVLDLLKRTHGIADVCAPPYSMSVTYAG